MSNAEVRDAVRFYSGDLRKRLENGDISCEIESVHPFYSDAEIYRTMNALMFPGIDNEKERIFAEEHRLNSEAIKELRELLKVYRRLAEASRMKRNNEILFSRRVDRISTVRFLQKGEIPSFFSTGKNDFQLNYSKKDGLVLLEFEIEPDIPVIDMENFLGNEYLKTYEREVLIPPFLSVELIPVSLSESEKSITDLRGEPPKCKYKAVLSIPSRNFVNDFDFDDMLEWLTDESRLDYMAEILENLNAKKTLSEKEENDYCFWKEKFINYIKYVIFA